MAGTKLKALIRPLSRGHDEVDTVDLELMNPDGSPYSPGGGGGGGSAITQYIDGHGVSKGVMGVSDYLYFDGTETGVDIVGIDLSDDQAIDLPAGIYTSSWQVGFDVSADDGPGDTVRGFRAEVQPLGKQLERVWQKPAGGWADADPYPAALAFNFILPTPQSLTVMVDGSTSGESTVNYYMNFTLIRLGDLPA